MALLRILALIFAFLGFVVFCVLYFLRSNWRSTSVGRNAMALMAACGLLLGLGITRLFTGAAWFERHRDSLGAFSYILIGLIVWWRNAILFKLQHRPRDRGPSRASAKPPDPTN